MYGSVCSGIEAASVAWEPLGWTPVWFAEVDKFPSEVLVHHWPQVENLGDMTKIRDRIVSSDVVAPDVLVGGTPCQAFSVAGLRNSLEDDRGQLTLEFVRLADAIDKRRTSTGLDQSIIVWENVPGVLNTKDNAFGCFLGALAGEECELQPAGKKWSNAGCVFGPKRAIAWRILDAQHFGVAQRRRRVFVVASARAGFDPAEVLFEREGLRRDTPPSREARKEAAGDAGTSASVTIKGFNKQRLGEYSPEDIGSTCAARDYKDATDLVVMTCATKQQAMTCEDNLASTLGANDYKEPQAVFSIPGNWIGRKPENGGNAVEPMHDVAPCQTATDRHGVAYAFAENSRAELRLEGGDGSRTGSISTGGGKPGQGAPCVLIEMAVRRLTPIECERLQGFPDNHTQIPWRGKPASECPDGPRYKALGNSMAVPCMRFIGERIARAAA